MKRRKFINSTISGLTYLSITPLIIQCTFLDSKASISNPLLMKYIWDESTVEKVGIDYLQLFPSENNEQKLVEILLEKLDGNTIVEHQLKEDFNNHETVQIEGWILSKTEVQQCALYSLIKKTN